MKLHQQKSSPEVGYLLENVNSSDDGRQNVESDFETVRYVLGKEVVTGAARHNSCAHKAQETCKPPFNANRHTTDPPYDDKSLEGMSATKPHA